jgi:hypothetical protein
LPLLAGLWVTTPLAAWPLAGASVADPVQ